MKINYLKAYVGSGAKLHIGYEIELSEGRKMLKVQCGSKRAGTRIFTNGTLYLDTYSDNRDACEKCLERIAERVEA